MNEHMRWLGEELEKYKIFYEDIQEAMEEYQTECGLAKLIDEATEKVGGIYTVGKETPLST